MLNDSGGPVWTLAPTMSVSLSSIAVGPFEPEDQDEGLTSTFASVRKVFSDVGTSIMKPCGGF